ncbi:hypothetical protein DFJ73DRAFT_454582 [Zopfochytrium polystomum]|nr:hypothetical protein DFJ73DRAFT_454582 [Zopfochytrium polystomum]
MRSHIAGVAFPSCAHVHIRQPATGPRHLLIGLLSHATSSHSASPAEFRNKKPLTLRHYSHSSPGQDPLADQNASASKLVNARQFNPRLNYRYIRDNVASLEQNLRDRNIPNETADVNRVATLFDQHLALEFQVAQIRRRRNSVASDMADVVTALKKADSSMSATEKADLILRRDSLAEEGKGLKKAVAELEVSLTSLAEALYNEAKHLPNATAPDVPVGNESKAEILEIVGVKKTSENAIPLRDHVALCRLHGLADLDRAGKVSGSGFYYLTGIGALLESALTQFALDHCIRRGFVPVSVPDVIRHEVLEGCGFAPRSHDPQTYFLETHLERSRLANDLAEPGYDPLRLCLTATAEFPLAAMYAGETLPASSLPLRLVGVGRAFRAEGLSGATNRGLYRVHQFQKVEMFGITAGGELSAESASQLMMEEFRRIQKTIFEELEICFRVLNMPTEELGAPACKKYDMEAWMPGRESWGEISSTSNCTDYQSRRLNIRHFVGKPTDEVGRYESLQTHFQPKTNGLPDFVHTVNGTAAAIPRLIIALLETHQQPTGDIYIPVKLRPYLLGGALEVLRVDENPFRGLP